MIKIALPVFGFINYRFRPVVVLNSHVRTECLLSVEPSGCPLVSGIDRGTIFRDGEFGRRSRQAACVTCATVVDHECGGPRARVPSISQDLIEEMIAHARSSDQSIVSACLSLHSRWAGWTPRAREDWSEWCRRVTVPRAPGGSLGRPNLASVYRRPE